jgi:hypothetical protein
MDTDQILERTENGITTDDDLFAHLSAPIPEICKPHARELDGEHYRGCTKIMFSVGKVALEVESDAITLQEGLQKIASQNTCDICPVKTIS